MRHILVPLCILPVIPGCGSIVVNEPRTEVLDATYKTEDVRSAVARAVNRRKLRTREEADGKIVAQSKRTSPSCLHTITYGEHKFTIASAIVDAPVDEPPSPPGTIDSRCLDDAKVIAKVIKDEVKRPAKEAAKAEKARRRHEEFMASQAAARAQADLARAQIEAAPPPPPQSVYQPQFEYSSPAPAPAPITINNNRSDTRINRSSNTTIHHTVVNAAKPPEPPPPRINPLLCCHQHKPYVCPNADVYAAACLLTRDKVANFCTVDTSQARYCR
jgi:hypothetical protein